MGARVIPSLALAPLSSCISQMGALPPLATGEITLSWGPSSPILRVRLGGPRRRRGRARTTYRRGSFGGQAA